MTLVEDYVETAATAEDFAEAVETPLSAHFVTVIRTDKPCGKKAAIVDGALVFESQGSVIEGVARIVHAPTAGSLYNLLAGLSDHEYLTPDFIPALIDAGEFRITTKAKYGAMFGNVTGIPARDKIGTHVVTLNSTEGVWAFGAWRLLDRDIDEHTPEKFRGDYPTWLDQVEALIPGVKRAPRVLWPSSKTRAAIAGGEAMSSSNGHTWIDCSAGGTNASAAMRDRLYVRASNLGLTWEVPKKDKRTGKPVAHMTKTLIDISVWTIHRNVYAGAPTVGDGVDLLPAQGGFQEGEPIDLHKALPEPTDDEIKVHEANVGVTVNRRGGGRLSLNDDTRLTMDSVVELHDGAVLTVAEFLRSDKYLIDTKYRCQSMFRESSSWNGIIRKFENGKVMHHDNGLGITFWSSETDWRWLCERYALSQKRTADQQLLADGLAMIPAGEWALCRTDVGQVLGVGKTGADTIRKGGTKRDPQAEAVVQCEREYRDEQIREAAKSPPKDIVSLASGEEILVELFAHWMLMLGSTKTEAATFFTEPVVGGTGTTLRFQQFTIKALSDFCAARPIMVPTPAGTVRQCPVELWVSDHNRVGVRKVTFEPGLPQLHHGAVNLWRGWTLEPTRDEAGCAKFLDHVREVIAAGDAEVAEYVIKWMALRVQGVYNRKVGQALPRMNVAIVMRSVQGTGKGLFETYFAKIFGGHALITARGHGLTGRFNWSFAHLLLLAADEAFFAGAGEVHDLLKSFLTEPTFDFEQKYRDAVTLLNHCAIIMSTNKNWAVPADAGDRRMCVIDVSDCKKGDSAYFEALVAERDGNGPAALMGYLLDVDLTGFKVENFPKTEALLEQQHATIGKQSATFEWLLETLETGELDIRREDFSCEELEWPETGPVLLSRRDVGDAIRAYAGETRKFAPPSNESIGRELRKLVGCTGKQKGVPLGGIRERNVWELPRRSEALRRLNSYLKTGSWKA